MSLGNTYDNTKKNADVYSPTVYSQYRMKNGEGIVDKTCISFNFWNNSLKITISPRKDVTTSDGQMLFDYDNGISIYLNHTKARILAEEIKRFIADPVTYDNCGIPSGQCFITISRGIEYDSPSPLIIIRKIDENGSIVSEFAYQTKTDYYLAVRNYNKDTGTFDVAKDDYNNLELLQFITLLEEFYKAYTCATASSIIEAMKWEQNRQREWRDSVSAKLGIDVPGNRSSSRGYSSTSYFSNSAKSSNSSPVPGNASNINYTRTTLDDID